MIIAQLELLGSPKVHEAYVRLWLEMNATQERLAQLPEGTPDQATLDDLDNRWARITEAERHVITLMRRDLGTKSLQVGPGQIEVDAPVRSKEASDASDPR